MSERATNAIPRGTIRSSSTFAIVTALWLEFSLVIALWRRELLHLVGERSRWLGVVLQPLLFWFVIGSGIAKTFSIRGEASISYLTYFYPGTLIMTILFTTIFATISVIDDRQNGFLQAVLVAPGSRASLVIGKVAGVTTLALVQAVIYLLAAPLAGFTFSTVAWFPLLITLSFASIFLAAVNFIMAWVLRSSQAYHALMSVVLIPLWMVSGAMFPLPSNSWLALVMFVNPLSYSVAGVHHALMGGQSDIAMVSLSTSVTILAITATAAMTLAIWASRQGCGATK